MIIDSPDNVSRNATGAPPEQVGSSSLRHMLVRGRERVELALGMVAAVLAVGVLLLGLGALMAAVFGWWSVGIVLGGALWVLGSVLSE